MTHNEQALMDGRIGGPHCDPRVLHAPGACTTCDHFPMLQKARELWGIAFTGVDPDEERSIQCPAEQARGRDGCQQWPGNRPTE